MEIISILIPSILYLLFFALGIYIIIQNPQKKVFWYLGGAMIGGGLYILGIMMSRMDFSISTLTLWDRFLYVPAELATLSWTFAAFEFTEEFKAGIKANKTVRWLLFIITLITTFLLSFTNLLLDYSNPIKIDSPYIKWDFYSNDAYIPRMIFLFIKVSIPIIVFLKILSKKTRLSPPTSFSLPMLLASISLTIGTTFSMVQHFLSSRHPEFYNIPPSIQEFFILISMLLIAWTILNPKPIVKDMLEIAKDFIHYIGYSILLLIPYSLLIFLSFKLFKTDELLIILILGISGLVVLTHSTHEWVIEFIKGSIKQNKFTLPFILPSDINYALKNYNSPNNLEGSKLLKLPKVERLAQEEKISKVEALRQSVADAIEYFKPQDKQDKRTVTRLKYEILRMMAYEGATESQIMWDLGFDVYTRSVEEKLSQTREPRYKLKDASEYSATSDRSFKRLKKEVTEMLIWELTHTM